MWAVIGKVSLGAVTVMLQLWVTAGVQHFLSLMGQLWVTAFPQPRGAAGLAMPYTSVPPLAQVLCRASAPSKFLYISPGQHIEENLKEGIS